MMKSTTKSTPQVILKQNRKKKFYMIGCLMWREMPQAQEHQVLSHSKLVSWTQGRVGSESLPAVLLDHIS